MSYEDYRLTIATGFGVDADGPNFTLATVRPGKEVEVAETLESALDNESLEDVYTIRLPLDVAKIWHSQLERMYPELAGDKP